VSPIKAPALIILDEYEAEGRSLFSSSIVAPGIVLTHRLPYFELQSFAAPLYHLHQQRRHRSQGHPWSWHARRLPSSVALHFRMISHRATGSAHNAKSGPQNVIDRGRSGEALRSGRDHYRPPDIALQRGQNTSLRRPFHVVCCFRHASLYLCTASLNARGLYRRRCAYAPIKLRMKGRDK